METMKMVKITRAVLVLLMFSSPAALLAQEASQPVQGEVQLRGALFRANDQLLAKDEEIAQLQYVLARLRRQVNDAEMKKLEPDLLKSFGAPPGSGFDWRTFKVIPPPTTEKPPAAPTSQPAVGSKGKPTP